MSILSADDITQAEHYTKKNSSKTVADFNVIPSYYWGPIQVNGSPFIF